MVASSSEDVYKAPARGQAGPEAEDPGEQWPGQSLRNFWLKGGRAMTGPSAHLRGMSTEGGQASRAEMEDGEQAGHQV